jgi:hypothetical protein
MNYAFLLTHYGSGGTLLCRLLNEDYSLCALGCSGLIYNHPAVLEELKNKWMSESNRKFTEPKWCIDKLVQNCQISNKSIYDICKFIYLIREPIKALPNIVQKGFSPESAGDYYCFRLRRFCEMAVKTPGAILITYENLIDENIRKKKYDLIEKKLKLTNYIGTTYRPLDTDDDNIAMGMIMKKTAEPHFEGSQSVINRCLFAYDRYFKFLSDHLES